MNINNQIYSMNPNQISNNKIEIYINLIKIKKKNI